MFAIGNLTINRTVVCGHLHLFNILMKYGAPVHTPDVYGAFPVHYAAQLCGKDGSIEGMSITCVVKMLIFSY